MKYYVIFMLIISQVLFIDARTVDDVLQDFLPIYNEIHQKVSNDQGFVHSEGATRIGNAKGFISMQSSQHQRLLEGATSDIRDTIRQIVGENGMIPYPELIKHCNTKEQADLGIFIKESFATSNLCSLLGTKQISYIANSTLEIFYPKQFTFHTDLDATKTKCKSVSSIPLDMQTCLIEQLYFVYKPKAKELEIEMNNVLVEADTQIGVFKNYTAECFKISGDNMVNNRFPIIEEYRTCVVEAANNKP